YVLALAISVDGGQEREVVLHLALSAFTLVAGFAAASLARRFGAPAWLLVPLLLLSPAVLPGTNCMLDTPALALSLAALALHMRGVDEDSPRLLAAGGLVAGLAFLAKYSAAPFLALMGLYSLFARRPRTLAALAIPAVMIGLWAADNVATQ